MIDTWKKVINNLFGNNAEMSIVSSENVTISKFEASNPIDLPAHSHIYEQISIVLEGEMIIKLGNTTRKMKKDDVCIIPSNVEHSASFIVTPFKSFDIFTPKRKDFVDKE